MRGEGSIAELCRREGINPNMYYKWSKEFLEAGKMWLTGDTKRESPHATPEALRELVQIVQVAARQRGRPYNNVLEMLPSPDDESNDEQEVKLSLEGQLLRDLVHLAVTIRDDGQINPLTMVDVSQGVTRQFRIETGEHRYWATWLLRDFIPNTDTDGMISCIIIPLSVRRYFVRRRRTPLAAVCPRLQWHVRPYFCC